jgi:hypothetical protein
MKSSLFLNCYAFLGHPPPLFVEIPRAILRIELAIQVTNASCRL